MFDNLESQYRAALHMMRRAVEACPDDLWDSPAYENRFWRLAYHTLLYTHLYLSPSEEEFVPWKKGIENAEYLSRLPWPPHEEAVIEGIHTREELLEYTDHLLETMPALVRSVPLERESGFSWIPFNRFELHLYNIRHLGLHTGQLIERLRSTGAGSVSWIGLYEG